MTDTPETTATTQTSTEPVEPRFIVDSNEPIEPTEAETEAKVDVEKNPEAEEQPEESEQQQKKRDAQARIRQLAAEKRELEQRLAEIEQQKQAKPETQNQQESKLQRPDPANYVGGKFNDDYQRDYENYIEKVAEERALKAIEQKQKVTEVENKVSQIQRAEEVFMQQHADYTDVLQDVIDSGILDATVYQAIIDLPNSPEIVYKIGSDPDLLAELSAMSPNQRLLKIGAIAYQSQQPQQAQAKPKISNAPKPITPIGNGTAPVLNASQVMEAAEKAGDYDSWKAAKYAKRN